MTIADLITGAGASITLLKTAIAARDESKIEAALSDLQTKYGDLGGMVIGLVEKIHVFAGCARNGESRKRRA